MATDNPKHWTISGIWHDAFQEPAEEIKPRNYLYASEVGSSFIDTYLKMKGVQYTNYPTSVAKMKMEAGVVWEGIVKFVLKRAGLLKEYQKKIDFRLKGCLSVHGKIDFIAGGKVDIRQAVEHAVITKALFADLHMPDKYIQIAENVSRMVQEMAENGEFADLYEYIIDIKSVSQFVWELMEGMGKPAAYHKNQVFHYLLGDKREVGRVTYINRDDTRIREMPVYNNEDNLLEYKDWVTRMTDYWQSGQEPPKEPYMVYLPATGRFYKNTMGVEWSRYLMLVYGFQSPNEFRELVVPIVKKANYVFKRCVNADKITDKNLQTIKEVKEYFPNFDHLVDVAKLKGVIVQEEEETPTE